MKHKLISFLICFIISIVLMLSAVLLYRIFYNGVLYFDAIFIGILAAFVSFLLWTHFNKEKFEALLVFMSLALFNILILYFGPVTLDRSLSSFVYFYSVENGSIPEHIYNDEYFIPYIDRRIIEGEKMGFLSCNNEVCNPTFKAKFLYYLLNPIGRVTKTLNNYDEFKLMLNSKQ